ncbi:hypothetical protein CC80DRAFT_591093 [Byssothecium circinans]|uniref:Uncharacterized protein n=1 Tax=Byssothecium circinans TaxID=147558 RepID=A0A6A5U4Z4_9PLEO|nr:hypothetical protein CC80DRAFT_591093 [Byssothecium circinans]
MANATYGYQKVLLALSGDAALTDARNRVFDTFSNGELVKITLDTFTSGLSRESQEKVAALVFDLAAEEQKTRPANGAGDADQRVERVSKDAENAGSEANDNEDASPRHSKKRGEDLASAAPSKRRDLGRRPASHVANATSTDGEDEAVVDTDGPVPVKLESELAEVIDLGNEEQDQQQRQTYHNIRFDGILDLHMVLWKPDKVGGGTWVSLGSLPQRTIREIKYRFATAYQGDESKTTSCDQMVKDWRRFAGTTMCVNRATSGTFILAQGDTKRACDICVRRGRLCVRLIELDGTLKRALYPLPAGKRGDSTFEEIDFWVI